MTIPTPTAAKLETAPGIDLISRYSKEIAGHLRCFDRMIVHGTLVDVAHPGALLVSMNQAGFRPRDLARFAEPITRQVRDHIIGLARRHQVEIEMVMRKNFRQEDRIAAILQERGTRPGLVHVFAVKECPPGCRCACRCISMATTGWRANWTKRVLVINWPTMRL